MKNVKRRILASILIFVMVFTAGLSIGLSDSGWSVKAATNQPTRVINLVYDDSGSMIYTNNNSVDTWCQAKYSMEVFAAMLGDNDTMNVYVMSDFSESDASADPRLTLRGADGSASNVSKVHNMITTAGNTPFTTVEKAYSDLEASTADEKWLIVLTDGAFQGVDDIDGFFGAKADDVSVMFLGMGADADSITPAESQNIFCEKAETSSEILNKLTDISTRVFSRDKLPAETVDVTNGTFYFDDVPMSELIVFAQGSNVQIGDITAEDGSVISGIGEPVEVKYSETASGGENPKYTSNLVVDSNLKGAIMTYQGDFDPGKYSIDISGAETIEIFYTPNVELAVFLEDGEGNRVEDMDHIEVGTYTISYGFVKTGTRDEVSTDSGLLGDVSYSSTVTLNGQSDGKTYLSGDKITLEEGTFAVDVSANYLKYNTTSASLQYDVYENKNYQMNTDVADAYIIDDSGITNADTATLVTVVDKETGLPTVFTEEEWNDMPLMEVSRADGESGDFNYIVEKTATPGVYAVYPELRNKFLSGKDYSTEEELYGKVSYTNGYGNNTADGTFTVKYVDTRSWLDRNKKRIITISLAALALLFLLGYPLKKKLPNKKLKKAPTVEIKPNIPGHRKEQSHGAFRKKKITYILPYVPQRGTIKFLPAGVSGPPVMQVKACGGGRMEITNTSAYAENKNFAIDGMMVEKTRRNLRKSAGMLITYKTKENDYSCQPNS